MIDERLFRHWVHLREQDRGMVQTYVPYSQAPPGRGRNSLEFTTDGVVIDYRPSYDDTLEAVSGRWVETEPDHIYVSFVYGRVNTSYTIVEISDDVLRVLVQESDPRS